jgi:DnaJ-class molecular chaperone
MSEINEAYQHLSDIVLKAKYGQAVSASLDLYQMLGVQSYVDAQMIHAAYEALARKHKSSPNRLNGINRAYAVLSDASERKDYDFQQKSLADANNRVLYNYKHRNSTDVSNRRVIFKRQSPVVYSWRKPGLSLWKVYLAYNLTFYVFMTAIFILITIM